MSLALAAAPVSMYLNNNDGNVDKTEQHLCLCVRARLEKLGYVSRGGDWV